jgi:hypothetical protein
MRGVDLKLSLERPVHRCHRHKVVDGGPMISMDPEG